MNRAGSLIVAIAISITSRSIAGELQLEGEVFRPSASVTWAATNAIPENLTVYKTVSQTFSPVAISNAMSIGSFKLLDRIPGADKTMMLFQDKREKLEMTRYLKVSLTAGTMSYYDRHAAGIPVNGVPSFDQIDSLALGYLSRFGGITNQIANKSPRMEGTISSFDKKGGRETNKVVYTRGGVYYRQVDGVVIAGNSFWIDFGNNAKPSMFELTWPKLQALQKYKTAKPREIVNWLKAGRAVNPNPEASIVRDAPLTITKVTPFYRGMIGLTPQEVIYPYARIEVTANLGKANRTSFTLDCPIIDETHPMKESP